LLRKDKTLDFEKSHASLHQKVKDIVSDSDSADFFDDFEDQTNERFFGDLMVLKGNTVFDVEGVKFS
jgi:hypothetical protein